MRYFLVDNGSLQPESVLNLRHVAGGLSMLTELEVEPASLLHSSKIPPEKLHGESAVNLERHLRLALEKGERAFTVIPFFIGPTGAIIDYLPKRIAARREKHGDFEIQRSPFLYTGIPEEDEILADILTGRIQETITNCGLSRPKVAMVDHGSPLPRITEARNDLARQVKQLLGDQISGLEPASMERREGEEYAFNEPLLENLLRRPGWDSGNVVISMLFLSPGRHAGPDGDVASICRRAEMDSGSLDTHMTGLVGTHPNIVNLLTRRLEMPRISF